MFARTFGTLALVAVANAKNLRSDTDKINTEQIDNEHYISNALDQSIWESVFDPGIVDANTIVFNFEKKIDTIQRKNAKEYCKNVPIVQDIEDALKQCIAMAGYVSDGYFEFSNNKMSNETVFINEISMYVKGNEDEDEPTNSIGYIYITGYTKFIKLHDKDGNERLPTEDEVEEAYKFMQQRKGLNFIPFDFLKN